MQAERRKERDKQRDLLTLTHLYFYDEHSPRHYPVARRSACPAVTPQRDVPADAGCGSAASPLDRDTLRKPLASPRLVAAARASARCQKRALSLALESPLLQSPDATYLARQIAAANRLRPDGLASPMVHPCLQLARAPRSRVACGRSLRSAAASVCLTCACTNTPRPPRRACRLVAAMVKAFCIKADNSAPHSRSNCAGDSLKLASRDTHRRHSGLGSHRDTDRFDVACSPLSQARGVLLDKARMPSSPPR